ncbi:M20/M25/M40 family metallo-hydrolase [Acidobacteriota bacterium]
MRKIFLINILALTFATLSLWAQAPDPVIETLIDRIDLDRMHADIDTLVAFGTRRATLQGGLDAQDFVYARLEALGFADLTLHDFDANHDNVVAVYPGVTEPDEIYIIGAHYDSINDLGPAFPAPGADDNGTGTSGLLEVARIISESEIRFEATITLVAFASEELGRIGSKAFVADAIANGKIPQSAIVMDVLGYHDPGSTLDISFGTTDAANPIPGTMELVDVIVSVIEGYLPGYPWEYGDTCT